MVEKEDIYKKLNEAIEKFINEDIIPFTSGDFQKMIGVKSLKDVDGNIVPWTSYFDDLIGDSSVNEFLLFLQSAGDISLSERDTRQIGRVLWDAKTNPDALKGFALNKNKVDNVGHLVWSTIQTQLPHLQASFVKLGQPDDLTPLGDNLVKYFNIPDTPTIDTPTIDTPTNVVDDVTEEIIFTLKGSAYEYLPSDLAIENVIEIVAENRGVDWEVVKTEFDNIKTTRKKVGKGFQVNFHITSKNELELVEEFVNEQLNYVTNQTMFREDNANPALEKYLTEKYNELQGMEKNNLLGPSNVVDDTPGGSLGAAKLNDPLVFDSWVDNLGRTTASFVDNLPLETVVKNRVKNLITTKTKQLTKPGRLLVKTVDAWEFGVIGLMAAGIAFNEIDEVPTIINNTAINMFNSMTASYGIAPVAKEEYDIDYEFINTVLDTGSKVMPTDIIIEKLKPYSLEEGEDVILPGTGVTATTGAEQQFEPYGEELAKRAEKTVNIKRDEVKQKLLESKGVQEEKMFEQAKPKKSSGGGSGVKIL